MAGIHERRFPRLFVPRLLLTGITSILTTTAMIMLVTIAASRDLDAHSIATLSLHSLNALALAIWFIWSRQHRLLTIGGLRHFALAGLSSTLAMVILVISFTIILGNGVCSFSPRSPCSQSVALLIIHIFLALSALISTYLSHREVVKLHNYHQRLYGHLDLYSYEALARDRTALIRLGFLSPDSPSSHSDGFTHVPTRNKSRRSRFSGKSATSATETGRDLKVPMPTLEVSPPKPLPEARHTQPSPYMANVRDGRGTTTTLGKAAYSYF